MQIAGLLGAPVLFAIVIFIVWTMETHPPEFYRHCISCINTALCFIFFYMLGYVASILHPEPEKMKFSNGNNKSTSKLHIRWDLLQRVLLASLIAMVPAVGLLLFSGISIYVFEMWAAGVVGFAMGFSFWEHIKETGFLTDTLKRKLVIPSLLTTIAVGYIAGYGVYVDLSVANPESIQTLLVSTMLFTECMAWYMVGLCVVAFRKG